MAKHDPWKTPSPSFADTIASLAHGVTKTATLGASRKAEAGIAAAYLKLIEGDKRSFKDIYGEALSIAPIVEERLAAGNKVADVTGQILGALALPWKTTNLIGGAKLGALYGGASGVLSNTEGDVGELGAEDVFAGGKGALLGGLLGLGGQAASNYLTKKMPPPSAIPKNIEAFEKFKIPFKKSDITANPLDVATEENALIGEFGGGHQANLKQFNENQRGAFGRAQEGLHRETLGAGQKFTEKGVKANDVVENLQTKALKEYEPIGKAYEEAKNSLGKLDINRVEEFPSFASDVLQSQYSLSPANAPKAYQQLKSFNELFGKTKEGTVGVDFQGLETWRQGLNKAITNIEKGGQDEVGVNALKGTFDSWIDNSIENALIAGDTKILDKFKHARALNHQWMSKYYGNGSNDAGKAFVKEMVQNARQGGSSLTPEIIVNKIFGTSELGFNNEAALIVKELKKHIPTKALDKLRSEAGARLLKPLLKQNPNVTTYMNNLNRFLSENHTLAKELFTKKQVEGLQDFGKVAHKIYGSKIISKLNPSQSGTTNKINKILDKQFPWIRDIFRKPVELNQANLKKGLLAGEKIHTQTRVRGAIPILTRSSGGRIQGSDEESKQPNSQEATKPFKKSSRAEKEEEQGAYSFGDLH